MTTHIIKQELTYDGLPISPIIPNIIYNDSTCGFAGLYKILGSATDQAIDLSKITTIKRCIITISTEDIDKLTMKVGASTQALPVGEITTLSEDVSTLYFTNSDTEEVYIKVTTLSV